MKELIKILKLAKNKYAWNNMRSIDINYYIDYLGYQNDYDCEGIVISDYVNDNTWALRKDGWKQIQKNGVFI